MSKNYVRLAGMLKESLVNGPGIRRVIFAQGCRHNCPGCFNQHTHDFNGGELIDMDELLKDIEDNPMLRGVTFSGGDPFEQADKFSYMAQKVHSFGKNVWCYTGYTYEFIAQNTSNRTGWKDLIENIDVLIDGKFEENLKDPSLKYRGSSNQRIIDVSKSLKSGSVVLFKI